MHNTPPTPPIPEPTTPKKKANWAIIGLCAVIFVSALIIAGALNGKSDASADPFTAPSTAYYTGTPSASPYTPAYDEASSSTSTAPPTEPCINKGEVVRTL